MLWILKKNYEIWNKKTARNNEKTSGGRSGETLGNVFSAETLSDCARHSGPDGRFFTLIELMTVISIIVILVALLFPSLRIARASAQGIACASNLNQLGKGVFFYVSDWNGFYPHGCSNNDSGHAKYFVPYIAKNYFNLTVSSFSNPPPGIVKCPNLDDIISYRPSRFFFDGWFRIPHPSGILMVGEVDHYDAADLNPWWLDSKDRNLFLLLHNKRTNVLFCEGHVETMNWNCFNSKRKSMWRYGIAGCVDNL